ncbi:MAG: helix-turn-helix domain-containing protein [Moraxellaceae bacterium]|nr:helix-turn-helix domain-containing protein [Moraxellaceae bacterium]
MNINDLPFLPVVYLTKLAECMAEENIQVDYILRDCGISNSILHNPEAFLSVYQVRAIVSHYLGLTGQNFVGVRYGKRMDLMTHGLFGYVFITRLPFRELMTNIFHYLQVRLPLIVLELKQEPDYIALRLSYKQPLFEVEAFITQAFLSSLYTLTSLVTKHISLHFQGHSLTHGQGLSELLPIPIECNSTYNEIRLYATEQHHPVSNAVKNTQPDPFYEHGLVVKMRAYILTKADEAVSAEDVAQFFNMSVRTLRRRLADIGMSFNEIRLEVRMQAAMRYLKTSHLSIERIANVVGYSDQASFTRAFQKWAGSTPDVVRRKHRLQNQNQHSTIIQTKP